MGKSRKKRKGRKRSGGGSKSSGGGGGVMVSMRSGFKNVAKSATGKGKKKPQTPLGKALNWGLTIALLAVAAYLAAKRFGYIE